MNSRYSSNLVAIFLLLAPVFLWARQPIDDYHWPHSMWGNPMILGPLMMLLFFILIVTIIVLVLRRPNGQKPDKSTSPDNDAVNILRERFARGEIDKQEYEERIKILRE